VTTALPIDGDAVHWHPGMSLATVSSTRTRLTFFGTLGSAGEATTRRWQAMATATPACKRAGGTIRQASSAGVIGYAALALKAFWLLHTAHLPVSLAALIVTYARVTFGKAFIGWCAMHNAVWFRNALIRAAVRVVDASVARGSATGGGGAAVYSI
jgi:hypothetical protein